jgi:hypothetical protein
MWMVDNQFRVCQQGYTNIYGIHPASCKYMFSYY